LEQRFFAPGTPFDHYHEMKAKGDLSNESGSDNSDKEDESTNSRLAEESAKKMDEELKLQKLEERITKVANSGKEKSLTTPSEPAPAKDPVNTTMLEEEKTSTPAKPPKVCDV
jgi:hypothetical protein